ncbi:MAG: DUF2071 domain-containing protein [Planctomycetaceae bacterium]|jgi:uncharacterized protein|nr:DUF2071 domain-containing protein [Planctomycetaceae bacterium]
MDIDRILPRQRPAEKIKGHQSWRNLAFLHWEVPVEELERLLPEGLQPDLFQGKAYVGLVPFEMKNIRPAWCPKALGFNFLETNVRTYVLHRNEPGVFFFSLDASSLTAVKIARWMWHLPYFHSGMTFSNERTAYEYGLKRPDNIQSKIKIEAGQPLPPSQPDSLEYFLLERYLLFTQLRGRILRGQVHHVPYPACQASLVDFEDQLLEVNGFTALNSSPDLVHFSTGVDVEIYSLKRTD